MAFLKSKVLSYIDYCTYSWKLDFFFMPTDCLLRMAYTAPAGVPSYTAPSCSTVGFTSCVILWPSVSYSPVKTQRLVLIDRYTKI